MVIEMGEKSKLVLGIISLVGVVAVIIVVSLFLIPSPKEVDINLGDIDFKQFQSIEEFNVYINQSKELSEHTNYYGGFGRGEIMTLESNEKSMDSVAPQSGSSNTASDYSTTNIQVEGVDEADIVKNDGKYIYVATGQKVVILDAYPADEMKVLSEINFSG